MAADRLDLDGGFDVHDYRDRLKLRRQDAGSMTLSNPDGLRCPVCDDPFDRLFVTGDATVSFSDPPTGRFCVARTAGALLLFSH